MMQKQLFSIVSKNTIFKIYARNRSDVNLNVSENTPYKNLEHYRSLNAAETNNINIEEWNKAKMFDEIPGPKPLPILGNTWRFFLPKIGDFYGLDYLDIHRVLNEKYGDIAVIKKVIGRQTLVLLFNPIDIEKLHRNDGIWPIRKGFPSVRAYRRLRKEYIPRGGLMTLEGEEWYKFRSLLNPVLMQPKNITQYTDSINSVADELVDNMRFFSQQNSQQEMPERFEDELYKWALESVGLIMMDNHFGCLKRNSDQSSEPQNLMRSILTVFDLMYKLDVLPGVWKFISTPTWREYVKNLDFVLHTSLKHIHKRLNELEENENLKNEEIKTVLYQLSKMDRDVAIAWSAEMILSGVDTTAKLFAACLYFLSKNPDKQEKLRQEAYSLLKSKDSPVTKEILSKALYLKAVFKETTRMAPVAVGTMRITKKDMVLGGYQVPSDTHVLTTNLLICKKEEHFPKASEFIPERWLPSAPEELINKNRHPFVFIPFGFGPRSCIGKRLANLELEIATLKIIRNFELSWPHDDMVFQTNTLHGIAKPLKIRLKEI